MFAYLAYCFGCGFLVVAAAKSYSASMLAFPLWAASQRSRLVFRVPPIPFAAAAVIMGLRYSHWYVSLAIIPATALSWIVTAAYRHAAIAREADVLVRSGDDRNDPDAYVNRVYCSTHLNPMGPFLIGWILILCSGIIVLIKQ